MASSIVLFVIPVLITVDLTKRKKIRGIRSTNFSLPPAKFAYIIRILVLPRLGHLHERYRTQSKRKPEQNLQYLLSRNRTSMEAINFFSEFISVLCRELDCQQVLKGYEGLYNLRKYKITEIPPCNVISMYQHIVQKFYKNHNPGQSGTWVENQLRLYLWTVICYMELHRKNLSTMNKQDWDFFAKIFFIKVYSLFEYQARTLLDESACNAKWTDDEDFMLYNIIVRDSKAKWNEIAKQLFINSNKLYLRGSKQCRERWLNHLDPNKTKSEWSLKQYLMLFEHVQLKGKKWASLVKSLNEKRSEHSIKNKYNSIIKKQLRLTPELKENQICRQLIKKIRHIIETYEVEPNDEYLFGGCSLKLLTSENRHRESTNFKSFGGSSNQMQDYKNRFENFRKKIQKFSCNFSPNSGVQSQEPENKTFLIKQKQTSTQFSSQKQREENKSIQRDEDQIFYDQSFEVHDMMRPQFNSVLFTEDLKNFINENELDA